MLGLKKYRYLNRGADMVEPLFSPRLSATSTEELWPSVGLCAWTVCDSSIIAQKERIFFRVIGLDKTYMNLAEIN